jgi:anti-sigma factor RsiW
MDHSLAVKEMAAERYLLNELTPEARDAFEEHVFDCPECALDLRAAATFVNEAKVQLPAMIAEQTASRQPTPPLTGAVKPSAKRDRWFSWARPAFAMPAFATLLLALGYQNFVTLPALRSQATQPRLLAWVPLHGATRGGARISITADHQHGVALPIDLSPEPGSPAYTSYAFDLLDAQGKLIWSGALAAPQASEANQRVLLAIPGGLLQNGAYIVAVSGVEAQGNRTPVDRYVFDLIFTD